MMEQKRTQWVDISDESREAARIRREAEQLQAETVLTMDDLQDTDPSQLGTREVPRAETVLEALSKVAGREVELSPSEWGQVQRQGSVQTLQRAEEIEEYCNLIGPLSRAAREQRKINPDIDEEMLVYELRGGAIEPWTEAFNLYPDQRDRWAWSVTASIVDDRYSLPVEIPLETLEWLAEQCGASEDRKAISAILNGPAYQAFLAAQETVCNSLRRVVDDGRQVLPTEHGIGKLRHAAERIRSVCEPIPVPVLDDTLGETVRTLRMVDLKLRYKRTLEKLQGSGEPTNEAVRQTFRRYFIDAEIEVDGDLTGDQVLALYKWATGPRKRKKYEQLKALISVLEDHIERSRQA